MQNFDDNRSRFSLVYFSVGFAADFAAGFTAGFAASFAAVGFAAIGSTAVDFITVAFTTYIGSRSSQINSAYLCAINRCARTAINLLRDRVAGDRR